MSEDFQDQLRTEHHERGPIEPEHELEPWVDPDDFDDEEEWHL